MKQEKTTHVEITLRDYLAGLAMQELMQAAREFSAGVTELEISIEAYKQADAMLEARKK